MALAIAVLPADRAGGGVRRADLVGATLVTAGLMLGIYTVVGIESRGWTSARTLTLAAVSLALLAAFVVRQSRVADPLLPLRVFRSRTVSGANLVQMLTVSAMFAFQVLLALYLQRVLGYTALETGPAMLPAAVAIGGVSLFVSARLTLRFGERAVLITGLLLLLAAMVRLASVPVHASYPVDLLPVMTLIAGFGLVFPALTALGMSGAASDDAGLISGLFNTTQQIGMALGVAVPTTLAVSRSGALPAAGASDPEALTGGYRTAFAVAAGLLVAALAVTVTVLRPAAAALPATPRAAARPA
ncbi:MFS transporter [Nocardia sp. NPDC004568]|uniref:MFS transporter n=1 Tax=Nocardia sp. NPDC004568 TaxID=3154551 RepID=UPI0033A2AAF3